MGWGWPPGGTHNGQPPAAQVSQGRTSARNRHPPATAAQIALLHLYGVWRWQAVYGGVSETENAAPH